MIASSIRVKLLMAGLAVAAHGVAGVALAPRKEVQVEGGAGAQPARIGTSFADLAAGTLTAETAKEVTPAETPKPAEPAAKPVADAVLQPAPAPKPAPEAAPAALSAVQPEVPLPAVTPEAAPSEAPDDTRTLEAIEESVEAVTSSRRPVQRSAEFEARNKPPQPEPEPQPAPQPQTAPGNAETDATAGAAQGQQDATAKQQGSAPAETTAAGNAAARNYPGAVMRKISDVRKPKLRQSGSARVSFTIGASGALAQARIARSSGAAELDREALRLIQRAAPFPAPPPGAERSFALDIEFR